MYIYIYIYIFIYKCISQTETLIIPEWAFKLQLSRPIQTSSLNYFFSKIK